MTIAFWTLEPCQQLNLVLNLNLNLFMHTLTTFNKLPTKEAKTALFKCCGSGTWVDKLMNHFPFDNEKILFEKVNDTWYTETSEADALEAFSHHPKIGDVESLKKKFANTADWASNEQAGVNSAAQQTIQDLAAYNDKYFEKFGYIFIVCATGKSASEMLHLLKERVSHHPTEELDIAKGEQHKITLIRLKKLIQFEENFWNKVSQITTHILDTSVGTPAKGICIKLKKQVENKWQTVSLGITDADGRITDLLPAGIDLASGHYQMCFDTKAYFAAQNKVSFYPKVTIDFNTFDQTHYHVPLLLNPFGYSTYRGS